MQVVILADGAAVADYGAKLFKQQITKKPNSVLGLATGSTPLALYQRLIAAYQAAELSFAQVKTFNLDEYLGLAPEHPQSYRAFMQQQLFAHIDINPEHTHVPLGAAADPWQACMDYEQLILSAGGIDVQLLGLGRNGHIGFNEPTSSLQSRTRIKTLTAQTIADNARFFKANEYQPHLSITMGIGTILEAKKIMLLATGSAKAPAVQALVEGPLSAVCPASALQLHPQAIIVVDEAAASALQHQAFYRHIAKETAALYQRFQRQP
ncbi:glucosamine-6-phosphate deaminase [Rheinheimera sp. UJ51]|uniref:glucosamine-6-phosphate deaminase n=1 Tax=Rheinheimera sp. UJ51 TaxID=2892446 RepID=UPI001E4AABA0|nr:glucosamine-6-phosphate deaminase [Rheinheimera sp. UJ51]MCC5451105.1 glucosamine-6-phosphate deaminase [Rheinheimera sp. UJ51]